MTRNGSTPRWIRAKARARGFFVPANMPDERIVLEAADLGRAWRRVAHEIAEANAEGSSLMLVGIQRGGVALAQQLSETLAGLYGHPVATGSVEPGLHRDDLSQRGMSELRPLNCPAIWPVKRSCWSMTCSPPAAPCAPPLMP